MLMEIVEVRKGDESEEGKSGHGVIDCLSADEESVSLSPISYVDFSYFGFCSFDVAMGIRPRERSRSQRDSMSMPQRDGGKMTFEESRESELGIADEMSPEALVDADSHADKRTHDVTQIPHPLLSIDCPFIFDKVKYSSYVIHLILFDPGSCESRGCIVFISLR